MNEILFASNVAAIMVFAIIFYRLIARCSAIIRARRFTLQMIKQVEAKVHWFCEQQALHDLSDKGFLGRLESNTRHPANANVLDFEGVLHRMTQFWKKGEVAPANRTLARWKAQVNGGTPDHRRFGVTSQQYGLFFTVLGGLLAFWLIGNSADDPFGVFKALALAMATTLGGLICNITIRHFLDFFGRTESTLFTKAESLLDQIESRVLAAVKQRSESADDWVTGANGKSISKSSKVKLAKFRTRKPDKSRSKDAEAKNNSVGLSGEPDRKVNNDREMNSDREMGETGLGDGAPGIGAKSDLVWGDRTFYPPRKIQICPELSVDEFLTPHADHLDNGKATHGNDTDGEANHG